MEHNSWLMPTFTLAPSGLDRSTISRHFPGWLDFGMTPKGLTWVPGGIASWPTGPMILPREISFERYSQTTSAFSRADFILVAAGRQAMLRSKPMRKPLRMPLRM